MKIAKKEKLAQYAERVWNVTEGSTEEKSIERNRKNGSFLQSLGIKPNYLSTPKTTKEQQKKIQEAFIARNWLAIGEKGIVKKTRRC